MRYFILLFSLLFSLTCNSVASNFNYATGFAAINEMSSKALINAMERVDDRIYAVGEHGIIIYSDDLEITGLNLRASLSQIHLQI